MAASANDPARDKVVTVEIVVVVTVDTTAIHLSSPKIYGQRFYYNIDRDLAQRKTALKAFQFSNAFAMHDRLARRACL